MDAARQHARILKVLAVETRIRILELLKDRPLCVNALAVRLGVTQGAVSQHLRIMRQADLVIDDKRGYHVHYRLNEQTLADWRSRIDALLDNRQSPTLPTEQKETSSCAKATTRNKDASNLKT